jgi:tetratricopeptide (TPR) repeat protein
LTTYSHHHARAAGRSSRTSNAPSTATSWAPIAELFHKPPRQKIAWGLLYTVLVITLPIGLPLLVTGLIQLPMPTWRQRALINRALSQKCAPDAAVALLDRAQRMHGQTAELTAARAELAYRQDLWPEAAQLYAQYLAVAPGDWQARAHYANSCLNAGWYDNAISTYEQIASGPLGSDDDSRAEIACCLALAFLGKGDVGQALAVVKAQPLQRRTLAGPLAACLYLRGVCEYLAGRRARGAADLDRLYAMAPGQLDHIQANKAAMQMGTFTFELPDGRHLGSSPRTVRSSSPI